MCACRRSSKISASVSSGKASMKVMGSGVGWRSASLKKLAQCEQDRCDHDEVPEQRGKLLQLLAPLLFRKLPGFNLAPDATRPKPGKVRSHSKPKRILNAGADLLASRNIARHGFSLSY